MEKNAAKVNGNGIISGSRSMKPITLEEIRQRGFDVKSVDEGRCESVIIGWSGCEGDGVYVCGNIGDLAGVVTDMILKVGSDFKEVLELGISASGNKVHAGYTDKGKS